MIVCQNVSKIYSGRYALENFTFSFEPGHIYAILGPNGSGKSTLMKILAGLVNPTSGQVYVDQHELTVEDKKIIAYMPTEPYFFSYMSAMQAAKYYKDFFDDFNMDKFLWTMNAMRLNPNQKIRTFSTGMMAKFKVALNVSRNPRLLMLDEPLNGIDMLAREEVTASILQGIDRSGAVLISSHLIEDLERISDYVLFIREGRLVVNGPTATFREKYGKSMTDMYREIFGAPVLFNGGMPMGYGMQAGYGMPGAQAGYGMPGMQAGYGAPGMPGTQAGYGAPGMPGMQAGYGAPGAQAGYGAPGAQAGYGAAGAQAGYGMPGAPAGYGAPGAQAGYGAAGAQQQQDPTPEPLDNPLA